MLPRKKRSHGREQSKPLIVHGPIVTMTHVRFIFVWITKANLGVASIHGFSTKQQIHNHRLTTKHLHGQGLKLETQKQRNVTNKRDGRIQEHSRALTMMTQKCKDDGIIVEVIICYLLKISYS